jgi:hypothetical protein
LKGQEEVILLNSEICEGQNAEHLSFSFQLLMASFITSITWSVLSWSKASICGTL